MAIKLKKLDPTQRSFVANGKTYYIETSLSIERFHQYQIYEKEAGFSITFNSMVDTLKEAYQDLNRMKAADAAVKINNLIAGLANVEEKEHVLLKMCALYMNTEDEDRGEINEDIISRKIKDWGAEYEVEGFFTLALNTVSGFFKHYNEMRQIISDVEAERGQLKQK